MSDTANNFVAGGDHPVLALGQRIVRKSTNTGGVHVPSVNVDNIAVNLSPTNLALDASLQSILTALTGQRVVTGATPGASQKVTVGASSAPSAEITGTLVRVVSTTDCHLAFGANPTAAADGTCVFLPASRPEIFTIVSGQKIAAIQNTAAGTLFITVVS